MKLKAFVKKIEDVPEAFRGLYTETADGFVLDVDGADYKDKLNEFRTTNVDRAKKVEELTAQLKKFEGVDPEKWAEAKQALDMVNTIEEKDLIKGGKFDEVVERRLQGARLAWEKKEKDLATRINALEGESKGYRAKYNENRLITEIDRMVGALGTPRKGALDDIRSRALRVFKIDDDDNIVAEGYNTEGKKLTMEDWGKSLITEASHLWENGQGGGSGGGTKKPGARDTIRTVNGADPLEVGRNLEAIASGKVQVVQGD